MVLANRRRVSDAYRRNSDKIPSVDKYREAMRHDTGKPTTSVEMHVSPTSTQNSKLGLEMPLDAIIHYAGKATPSVATPIIKTETEDDKSKKRLGTPQDTRLENRRLSSPRRYRIPNQAQRNLGRPYERILTNRRRASRCPEKIAKRQTRDSYKTILANRRRASRDG